MSNPMIGSPSNLELLLHCYYSPSPHPRLHAPAIKEGIDHLLMHGMIAPSTCKQDVYEVTEKGRFYVGYLMTIPFPKAKWEMSG